MIFNEIYSAYYNAVAKIITEILKGNTNEKDLEKIVSDNAFDESMLNILPSLKSEKWKIVRSDLTTPLKHKPTMPLTAVQKQWLKAISLDPRMKLFDAEIKGLEEIEPLFTPDDYVIYDQYSDGDPYDDETYITHFRTILYAMKHGRNIELEMISRKGNPISVRCVPEGMEYSEKDDKFRLVARDSHRIRTINVARITKCRSYSGEMVFDEKTPEREYEQITLKVREERNTLERCMLHFAHFEKRAEKNEDHYLLHIQFEKDDRAEMVIRVLSFGPTVEVLEPDDFKRLMIDKLKRQKSCELF